MREIVLIVNDIRSTHNVGSLLRTADGLGVNKVYLTGYTPFPKIADDPRLPHLAARISKQINKTALGAEESVDWQHCEDINDVLADLYAEGFDVAALEQSNTSIKLNEYQPPEKIALLIGSEVEGVDKNLLKKVKLHIEIPMFGKKESFNVANAAAIALYHLRFN
ncbi:MAG TPA: TrmH family RNA methyltransferase [Candidatus Saccharimonadales bacterium]|nr:TrmH family RNA methyltransferase [Candidatus Saccharimonadales bacterium]